MCNGYAYTVCCSQSSFLRCRFRIYLAKTARFQSHSDSRGFENDDAICCFRAKSFHREKQRKKVYPSLYAHKESPQTSFPRLSVKPPLFWPLCASACKINTSCHTFQLYLLGVLTSEISYDFIPHCCHEQNRCITQLYLIIYLVFDRH